MSRKKRGLSPEDRALWARVTESARPMKAAPIARPFSKPTPATVEVGKPEAPIASDPLPAFTLGQKAGGAPRSSAALPATAPPKMDKRAYTKMRRGKTSPDARIDLHGMTVAAAHPALTAFLLRAHSDGKRLVLVITGKGRGRGAGGYAPETPGILRRQVPHWLQLPPLNRIVLQVAEAHQSHGGSGAFYVYLTRQR
jgi:DNA-nicking Smr family endonuclease